MLFSGGDIWVLNTVFGNKTPSQDKRVNTIAPYKSTLLTGMLTNDLL